MAREQKHYWARRPFTYNEQALDRGQVVMLVGALNDEKLVRLGYVAELESKAELHRCAVCGAEFTGIAERTHHGDTRHRPRDLSPAEEDAQLDRQERMLEQVAPLYLENAAGARA